MFFVGFHWYCFFVLHDTKTYFMIKPLDKVKILDDDGDFFLGEWCVVSVERGKSPEEYYCVSNLTNIGRYFPRSIVNKSPKIKCTNKR